MPLQILIVDLCHYGVQHFGRRIVGGCPQNLLATGIKMFQDIGSRLDFGFFQHIAQLKML